MDGWIVRKWAPGHRQDPQTERGIKLLQGCHVLFTFYHLASSPFRLFGFMFSFDHCTQCYNMWMEKWVYCNFNGLSSIERQTSP